MMASAVGEERNEILQMTLLEPTLSTDETDSGLDIDARLLQKESITCGHLSARLSLSRIIKDFLHTSFLTLYMSCPMERSLQPATNHWSKLEEGGYDGLKNQRLPFLIQNK
jgi:hypothetical protein